MKDSAKLIEISEFLTPKASQAPLILKLSPVEKNAAASVGAQEEEMVEAENQALKDSRTEVSEQEGREASKKRRHKSKAKRKTARMMMTLDGKLRLADSTEEEGSEMEISEAQPSVVTPKSAVDNQEEERVTVENEGRVVTPKSAVDNQEEERVTVENGGRETTTQVSEGREEATSKKRSKSERRKARMSVGGNLSKRMLSDTEDEGSGNPPKKLKENTPIKESAKSKNNKAEDFWKCFLQSDQGFGRSDMVADLLVNLPRMFDIDEIERLPTDKLVESFSQNLYDQSVMGASMLRRLSNYEQTVVPEKVKVIKHLEELLLQKQNDVEKLKKEKVEFENLKIELLGVKEELSKSKEELVEVRTLYAEQLEKNVELQNLLVQKEQKLEGEKVRLIDLGREAMVKAKEMWEAAFAGVNEQLTNEVASEKSKTVRETSPDTSAFEPNAAVGSSREPTAPAVFRTPQLPTQGTSTVQEKSPGQTSATPPATKDVSAPRMTEVMTQNPTRRSTRLSRRVTVNTSPNEPAVIDIDNQEAEIPVPSVQRTRVILRTRVFLSS